MAVNTNIPLATKNYYLCRKDLDRIPNGMIMVKNCEGIVNERQSFKFFHVKGITDFWKKDSDLDISSLTGDILSGCVRNNVPFAFALIGDESGMHIYIGILGILRESLKASYESLYPGCDIELLDYNPLENCPSSYGGVFTGIPVNKTGAEKKNFQIENICRGMQGKSFTYLILAKGIGAPEITFSSERIHEEMESVFSQITQTVAGGAQGNLSAQRQDFAAKNYFDNLEKLEQVIEVGMARGMWRVNGYYATDDQGETRRLGSIIKATFSSDQSRPEPFRILEYHPQNVPYSFRQVIKMPCFIVDPLEGIDAHPLGTWTREGIPQPITIFAFKYQSVLNSDQLATLCQLPSKEFPGFYIDRYVEFDLSNRMKESIKDSVPIGDICIAGRKETEATTQNVYSMEKNDFTRHALIIGITGGGKTNTSKSILNTLYNKKGTNFLVIESAKREYWELRNIKGFEDLWVFTLGAEASNTSVRYRINPFETLPQISLQTHIDYLLSTFKAAFDLYPPMPYILEKAVYQVYSDRGWDIVENTNKYGLTEYPTLSDLYNKIDVIVDEMGYHQEVQSNVKAALQARVYSLMIGGKGAMLNTAKSVPISELLTRPVVMELEDLGDDETKSFVIGLLLVQLYEYGKSQMTKGSKNLSHILMVEEAHRLLKNVSESGEGGNSRAKSVEFFCNLLAEIRTFGQGIIIADQIPTKLAPDTIKNTNLKIVHRTVAAQDRETIGKAMNMSEEQIEYLSSLRRGYAAVYAEGDNRPKCVKLPLVKSDYDLDRETVIKEARAKVQAIASGYDEKIHHHAACAFCEHRCKYYQQVIDFVNGNLDKKKVLESLVSHQYAPAQMVKMIRGFEQQYQNVIQFENDDKKRCFLGYILSAIKSLNDGKRQRILADYLAYIHRT